MISSVVNRSQWQRNDFCLLWTVVVENSTGSVHHEHKSLNMSHSSPESHDLLFLDRFMYQKVQVGKDQEKAQSEKDSHSKNQGGKKPN